MLKSFPLAFGSDCLLVEDFILFSEKFKKLITNSIPTCQGVHFFNSRLITSVDYLDRATYKELDYFTKGKAVVAIGKKNILCRSIIADGSIIFLLTGIDEIVLTKIDLEWMSSEFDNLVAEFLNIKLANIDRLTGFYNFNYLQTQITKENNNVLLVEVTLKGNTKRYFEEQLSLIINILNSPVITGSKFYIGHLTFAIIIENDDNPKYLTKKILHLFRKESIKSVHLGISGTSHDEESALDKAWTALFEARTRGSFTFCDYTDLSAPTNHQLYGLEISYLDEIKKKIKNLAEFSIVILQATVDLKILYEQLSSSQNNVSFFQADNEILVVLPFQNETKVKDWVANVTVISIDLVISTGISYYPNRKFTKSEVILQARKALQHTLFYGRGTTTLFNSVSLNISGDIFYGEGSLSKSIKEYVDAVYCDGKNINALNSLGVAYAMNGSSKSMECFDRVLLLDKDNFLAHYNKAFTYESRGQLADAVVNYEYALLCVDNLDPSIKEINLDELKYQLGILSYKVGKWAECIQLLSPFVNHHEYDSTICHCIGLSYGHLGNYKEAIKWLQKSPRSCSLEAEKYSYLGYYYLLENEGDNIAHSLCAKAVDIDPLNRQFKLHLAAVYLSIGEKTLASNLIRKVSKRGTFKSQMQSLIESLPSKP